MPYRVIKDQLAAVAHPETGAFVVPNPTDVYPDDDPMVRAYPWMFINDAEETLVEDATAAPGTKRRTRRV